MKYAFFTDDLHVWSKFSIEEFKQLGILENISEKSYVSNDRKYVYHEKNIDALLFIT